MAHPKQKRLKAFLIKKKKYKKINGKVDKNIFATHIKKLIILIKTSLDLKDSNNPTGKKKIWAKHTKKSQQKMYKWLSYTQKDV